jgi:hypothetical protein
MHGEEQSGRQSLVITKWAPVSGHNKVVASLWT